MFGFTSLEVRTYLILSVCGGLQILINQIEQPYARSLIVCDTPVNTTVGAEPSGSSHCGDRLYVIGQGALLSGSGESLENVGRFLMTLFVSGFADSHGRKAAAVVGWVMITASVLCFFLASFIAPWARVLFIMAQGLQGMSGIGLLVEIVTSDIVNALEGDGTGVYVRKNTLGAFLGIVFFGIVIGIQYSQITEFRPVWGAVVTLSVAVLGILVVVFPETQKEENRGKKAHTSLVQVVVDEVKLYSELMRDRPFIRYTVMEGFFNNIWGGFMIIFFPWMMANFGYSQIDLMVMTGPCIVLGLLCQPVVPFLIGKVGHRKTWELAWWFDKFSEWFFLPLLTFRVYGMPVPVFISYLRTPAVGFVSLIQTVGARCVDQKETAKYAALNQLNGFMTGSFSALLYSRVFDAEAKSHLRKIAPFLVASTVKLIGGLIYHYGHRPICLAECDRLTEEAMQQAQVESEKKTD